MTSKRPERTGSHRANYERNRKRIFATQNTCGICGHPVDFNLKAPHPMSAVCDHIIPVSKNGHPSDISNLQLAHWTCNRQKSDKIFKQGHKTKQAVGNRVLPLSVDWINYDENNRTNNSTKVQENNDGKSRKIQETHADNKPVESREKPFKQQTIIKVRKYKTGG